MTTTPRTGARSPTLAPAVLPQPSEEIDAEMASEMGTDTRSISRVPISQSVNTHSPRDGARSPQPPPPRDLESPQPQPHGDQAQTTMPNAASEFSSSTVGGDGDGDCDHNEKDGQDVQDAEAQNQREPDIYDRFSPRKKHTIVAIVSFSAFIGPVASAAFLPSINVMAEDLNTTPAVINYTVAIFIVAVGVAPLVWSPLSGFYGRKMVYLMSMPITTVASIGVAESHTVAQIIGTRILQGIGSSAVLSVGAGTVGDIYRPTERANAMAWFYSGILIGPAFTPVLAGVFTEYTAITWRATQYFLCACSALSVGLTFFFLPETSHPVLPHTRAKQETGKRFVFYKFNPLRSLGLLKYPNIVMTTITSSLIMVELYCIMVPLSTVFKQRYNIDNVAILGTLYLANGFGTIFGSRVIGPYADRIVKKFIRKRGYRRPEDRLHAALWGVGLLTPLSCLAYGWLLWGNKGGIAPPIVMLFFNGIGTQIALTPVNTYLVDAAQSRSAECIAVNNFWRYLLAAAASAFVLPMIDGIGLGWTMTVAAAACWLGFGTVLLTMWYGEKWREAVARRSGVKSEEVDGGRAPDSEEAIADADDQEAALAEAEAAEAAKTAGGLDRKRRLSGASSHSHRAEKEHGEPGLLPTGIPKGRVRTATLTRERSRRGSGASRASMPTVGEVLHRTASLGGASVHGGG